MTEITSEVFLPVAPIQDLDSLPFGTLIYTIGTFNETVNCIIGKTVYPYTKEDSIESEEKLIIQMDFSTSMKVTLAKKLGLKFFKGMR